MNRNRRWEGLVTPPTIRQIRLQPLHRSAWLDRDLAKPGALEIRAPDSRH